MPAMKRETGFLERDGERIYWESSGSASTDERPLVLCHGAGGNHSVWFRQVPHFATHRRVITWDQRGFGRSTARHAPNHPERAAADLRALLDHLDVERCDLVGQSMGGWAVLGAALAEPSRVAHLVLADTPGGIDCPEVRGAIASLLEGPAPLAVPDALGVHPALGEPFCSKQVDEAYLYQMLGGFGEPDLAAVAPGLLSHWVPAEALAAFATPTLLIVGALDPLFPPAALEAASRCLPDARVAVVERCGHSPYFEDPPTWNRWVDEFTGRGRVS